MIPKNIYQGNRYTPLMGGVWNNQVPYEQLVIVQWQGNSYTSKKPVPVGIDINDTNYWVCTGNYDAQVEQYRKDVLQYKTQLLEQFTSIENDIQIIRDTIGNNTDIGALTTTVNNLSTQVTNLATSVTGFNDDITLLNNLNSAMSNLTNQVNNLNNLVGSFTDNSATITTLNNAITNLTNQVNNLNNIVDGFNNDIVSVDDVKLSVNSLGIFANNSKYITYVTGSTTVIDWSVTIQKALDDAYTTVTSTTWGSEVGGITVYLPSGTLTLTTSIQLHPSVSLKGQGIGKTILDGSTVTDTDPAHAILYLPLLALGNYQNNILLEDFEVKGSSTMDGIRLYNSTLATHVHRVKINGAKYGIMFINSWTTHVTECLIFNCTQTGIYGTSANSSCISMNRIQQCATGIRADGASNPIIDRNVIQRCTSHYVIIAGCPHATVKDNYFENFNGDDWNITGSTTEDALTMILVTNSVAPNGYIEIINNVMYCCLETNVTQVGTAIRITQCSNARVTGLNIQNVVSGKQIFARGISLDGSAQNVLIENCILQTKTGVYINNGVNTVKVINPCYLTGNVTPIDNHANSNILKVDDVNGTFGVFRILDNRPPTDMKGHLYFSNSNGAPFVYDGTSWNELMSYKLKNYDLDGNGKRITNLNTLIINDGGYLKISTTRPASPSNGVMYFDPSGKILTYNGSVWKDAMGNTVA